MKRLVCLVFAGVACLSECVEAVAQGVIEGKVTLPPRSAEALEQPRYAIKYGTTPAPPEPPVAAVYLEGSFPASAKTDTAAPAQMGQKNFQFITGLLVIQKETRVQFPNYDDEYHNVLSFSKIKRFDLGRYRKDVQPAALMFDQPGVVRLRCEIHEHMRGTVLVVDTPYFTKTDTNGVYRLENLPAGNYILKAWVKEDVTWQRPVDLKAGETIKVDFPPK
jgi:plastocyanin